MDKKDLNLTLSPFANGHDQGSCLRFFHMVHWTSKFSICKIIESTWKLCGLEVPKEQNTEVSRFSSLKLWCPCGRHNVAGGKIKASQPAKSPLWRRDVVKREPWTWHHNVSYMHISILTAFFCSQGVFSHKLTTVLV